MDKVLVTTPRIGSNMKNREVRMNRVKAREGAYDELPRYSSMKPKSRGWDDRKTLNEYLNPLVRFLEKNRNRPWDKVYSEICKNMDRRGAVQGHIFEHLFDYVELNPIIRGGKPFSLGRLRPTPIYKTGHSFYVDNNGLLREPRERPPPWPSKESNSDLIRTDDPLVFIFRRSSDSVWFRITIRDLRPEDDLFYRVQPWISEALPNLVAKDKKAFVTTLSKREKKELGI